MPPLPEPDRRVAFHNEKGGVGKTTTTANVAYELARLGRRVLTVDCDPSGNLSKLLLSGEMSDDLYRADAPTLSHAVHPENTSITASDCIRPARGLFQPATDKSWPDGGALSDGGVVDVLPSDNDLARNASLHPVAASRLNWVLSSLVKEVQHGGHPSYDVVLIDCPPTEEVGAQMGVAAARHVVLVAKPEQFSVDGMSKTLRWIYEIGESFGLDKGIGGVIVNDFKRGNNHFKRFLDEVDEWAERSLPNADQRGYEFFGRRWGNPIPSLNAVGTAVAVGEPVSRKLLRGLTSKEALQYHVLVPYYTTFAINILLMTDHQSVAATVGDLLSEDLPELMRMSLRDKAPELDEDEPYVQRELRVDQQELDSLSRSGGAHLKGDL